MMANINYTDEQLQKIQDNLMNQLDSDDALEKEIMEVADKCSHDLAFRGKAFVEFNNRHYMLRARHTIDTILIIVADDLLFKIVGEKYRPAFIKGEIQNGLTYQENVRATVEAYFRHITNKIKPEELPD